MKPISTETDKKSANRKPATNQPAMSSQTTYQHNAHLPTLLVMNRGESPNFGAALGEFMFVSSNKMLDHQSSASYLFTDHRPQRTRLKSWTSNDISGDESLLLFPATGHESKSSPRFGPMLSSSPIWGASSLLTSGTPGVTLGEERTRNRNENSSQGRSPRAQVAQYRSGNERPISTSLVSPSGFSGDPDAFFMGNSRSIGDRSLPFGTSPIIRDMHNTSERTDIVLISDDVVPGYEFMSGSPRTQVLLEDSSDRNLNLGPSLTPSSSPQAYVVVSVPSVESLTSERAQGPLHALIVRLPDKGRLHVYKKHPDHVAVAKEPVNNTTDIIADSCKWEKAPTHTNSSGTCIATCPDRHPLNTTANIHTVYLATGQENSSNHTCNHPIIKALHNNDTIILLLATCIDTPLWMALLGCCLIITTREEARAKCVEIQALVKVIGDGDELPSNEASLSAYSSSLSLRKRGNGVRLLLLCVLPKEVMVAPSRAWSEMWASQGVVSL
jgi:hypothetical protein